MGLQIIPIIRALTPLIGASSSIVSSIAQRHRAGESLETEERIQQLETDVGNTGRVLSSLAEQVQVLATELDLRIQHLEASEKQLRIYRGLSIAALVVATAAIALVLMR